MFVSTVIPTVGRPTLRRAVESVLNQSYSTAEFEVIVVNDSGTSLPTESWQESPRVQIISTNRVERSVARNTGAAIARGRYLHFLDDDDWMASDALKHFWRLAAENREAAWIYGGSQLVDGANLPTVRLHHNLNGNSFIQVMAGEWIPLQASLVKADAFFEVGGFNPHIAGPEDIDLLRRLAYLYDLAETNEVVAFIVRDEPSSTTDYDSHPEQSRWAREKILDSPGVFSRMRESAIGPFWHGRIARLYATSLVWNLANRSYSRAASRLVFLLASLFGSGLHILSRRYWHAVGGPYESDTFARGLKDSDEYASNRPQTVL